MAKSNKLFSLIHEGGLKVAPKNKVLPAKAFSTLLSAAEVLKKVKEDAEQYRREVVEECEQLKEVAQHEGFEAGFQQWVEKIAQIEGEIIQVRREMEKMVVPVALKAAKKIVSREIELSENVILDIVSANLKAVAQHKRVIIYVNKKDLAFVEENKPKLKTLFEHLESLSVRERSDVQPGGCIIETEVGIINAQLENRWRVLEAAFEKMKAKE